MAFVFHLVKNGFVVLSGNTWSGLRVLAVHEMSLVGTISCMAYMNGGSLLKFMCLFPHPSSCILFKKLVFKKKKSCFDSTIFHL